MQQLTGIFLAGNPLTTFVLSEPLAIANLAHTVATLQGQGVNVFTYPLTVQLLRPQQLTGAFQFGIIGPPGAYTVFASSNLLDWSPSGVATNVLGAISYTDTASQLSTQRFYRVMQNAAHEPDFEAGDDPVGLMFYWRPGLDRRGACGSGRRRRASMASTNSALPMGLVR